MGGGSNWGLIKVNMSEKLTVIEQREVDFYDDQLMAIRAEDGQIYVSIRHMCAALDYNECAILGGCSHGPNASSY